MFMSLGGRLVLIRAVLTSLPVYWLAFASIPVSILNKMRQMIFSFLWGSSKNKFCFHLVDWQTLAMPFDSRGWGIKNLHQFSISLRLRSIWWVLKGTGIWHQFISTKYLKHQTLAAWLRNKNFGSRGTSIIWNGFLKTISQLGRCLCWKVADGRDVHIGTDPIASIHDIHFFPTDLRDCFCDYGITTLQHARNPQNNAQAYQLSTDDLKLGGDWKIVWNSYISSLQQGGIHLSDKAHSLLWSFNKKKWNCYSILGL